MSDFIVPDLALKPLIFQDRSPISEGETVKEMTVSAGNGR